MNATMKATRKEWIGLAVIALPCLLYSMDLTILNLALPAISADLHPSASQILWIVDIYGFMVSGWLITMGTLGDIIGRRKLLLIGAALFGLASIAAAFSSSAAMLITMRALLGVAGATVAPSTLSLIRNMFHDDKERTFAISIWITSYSVGGVLGPLAGGLLLEYYHWSAAFLAGVPIMLLLLVTGPYLLPEYRNPDAQRLDIPSTLLSIAAILCLVFALKSTAEHGISIIAAAVLGAGVILGLVFLRRQRHIPVPMLDLNLFRSRSFTLYLAAYMLSFFCMFAASVFLFQYIQLVCGLTPLESGTYMLPAFILSIIGSLGVSRMMRWFSVRTLMVGGLLLATAGISLLLFAGADGDIAIVVIAQSLLVFGITPFAALATDSIVGSAPAERSGAAAALSETCAELGGAIGIAVLGSLGMVVYRMQVMAHEGMPDAAAHSLTEAMALAKTVDEPLASLVRTASATAFTEALQMIAAVATVLLGLCAIVIYFTSKHTTPVAMEVAEQGE